MGNPELDAEINRLKEAGLTDKQIQMEIGRQAKDSEKIKEAQELHAKGFSNATIAKIMGINEHRVRRLLSFAVLAEKDD